MEAGKYSQLQEEESSNPEVVSEPAGGNLPWIGAHIQEIKDSLLEQITYYTEKGETDVAIQEQAVTILEHLFMHIRIIRSWNWQIA